jgi:hypothetical protein
MAHNVRARAPSPTVKLFSGSVEVCEVVAFRPLAQDATRVLGESGAVPATCCFTVPFEPSLRDDASGDFALVFENGPRFPIRIRHVAAHASPLGASECDVAAELI